MNNAQRYITECIHFLKCDMYESKKADDNLKRAEAIKLLAEAYAVVSAAELLRKE